MTLSNKASLGLKHVLKDYGIFMDYFLLKEQVDSSDLNDSCELIVDWITERYGVVSDSSSLVKFALKTYNKLSFAKISILSEFLTWHVEFVLRKEV